MKLKSGTLIVAILGVLVIWVVSGKIGEATHVTNQSPVASQKAKTATSTTKKNTKSDKAKTTQLDTKVVNWKASSESKDYPNLSSYPNAWLDVNIAKQRVYVKSANGKILYTMYCSAGANDSTRRGTYYIQAERGSHFYSASEQEGANYYVSWLNHGEFLFHTVPVDANGNYIKPVADNIGHKASSHGCVQLTIPDAQWVYNNVPQGMKVVIH